MCENSNISSEYSPAHFKALVRRSSSIHALRQFPSPAWHLNSPRAKLCYLCSLPPQVLLLCPPPNQAILFSVCSSTSRASNGNCNSAACPTCILQASAAVMIFFSVLGINAPTKHQEQPFQELFSSCSTNFTSSTPELEIKN